MSESANLHGVQAGLRPLWLPTENTVGRAVSGMASNNSWIMDAAVWILSFLLVAELAFGKLLRSVLIIRR